MARNPLKPTDEERALVKSMSAAGIPHERIAASIRGGIDDKTLRKWFRPELDLARDQVTAVAMGKLVAALNAGEAWAICFWMKCRANWHERQQIDHTVHMETIAERMKRAQARVKSSTGTVDEK